METHYFEAGIFDTLLENEDAEQLENGLARIISSGKNNLEPAEVCVKLVEEWILPYCYMKTGPVGSGEVDIVSAQEHAGIGPDYFQNDFWKSRLDSRYSAGTEVGLVAHEIPDDPVERLVFHFLEDWPNKFKIYFGPKSEAPMEDKVALLRKQLENIMYFGRHRMEGSQWRMNSLPDETLKQALLGEGDIVPIVDEHGNQMTTIQGRPISASANPNISQEEADGPKPDDLDKEVYEGVLNYAVNKSKAEKMEDLHSWTLVRATFIVKGKEVRCYAFSGENEWKRLLPSEWWAGKMPNNKNLSIFFANVSEVERLGQNMIMSIFEILRPSYEEDLQKLAKLNAFEYQTESQSLMSNERKDCDTLHYGEYYDTVMKKCNACNRRIMKAVKGILQLEGEEDHHIQCCVTCGSNNRQFRPNEKNLTTRILDPAKREKVVRVSLSNLQKLEEDLEKLPSEYLDKLSKQLGEGHCGEDNVLPLLLSKLLSMVDVFRSTRVEFIAMDGQNLEGKPFCSRCDRKVRFFSILPFVLRHLGATGKDDILEELFSELRKTQT